MQVNCLNDEMLHFVGAVTKVSADKGFAYALASAAAKLPDPSEGMVHHFSPPLTLPLLVFDKAKIRRQYWLR
jgi:hypothetical protein